MKENFQILSCFARTDDQKEKSHLISSNTVIRGKLDGKALIYSILRDSFNADNNFAIIDITSTNKVEGIISKDDLDRIGHQHDDGDIIIEKNVNNIYISKIKNIYYIRTSLENLIISESEDVNSQVVLSQILGFMKEDGKEIDERLNTQSLFIFRDIY